MSVSASFAERMRYRIDNFLGKGSKALFLMLTVTFLLTLCGIALLRFLLFATEAGLGAVGLVGTEFGGVMDAASTYMHYVWFTFLQLTDPGNMAQDNDTWTAYKISAVVAGMAGVVIFSALIAFLTTALDQAIASLKKGHSRVLEADHTLIIGWGPRVIEILRELVECNEAAKDAIAVVLSEEEKEFMDEYLLDNFTDRGPVRVVTRQGPTASLKSMEKVVAEQAKSAIVLASCSEAATDSEKLTSDAKVIKTVLALVAHVGEDHEINIVAEIFDPSNREVVLGIDSERISVIDAQEILAKIMVQTSRTSGLSVVYAELLSFEGCEMYFYRPGSWNGMTFGHAQFHFPDGVPIGVRKSDGVLEMRPHPETVLEDDHEVLIVAEDDSTIVFKPKPVYQPQEIALRPGRIEQRAEKMLVLGWSPKAPIVIGEYSDYVLEGSRVDVMIKSPPQAILDEIAELDEDDNIDVAHIDKDPLAHEELESVYPFSYNTVVILPQKPTEELDPERVDSETIIVLLHLRKQLQVLQTQYNQEIGTKLITEVLDSSNQELISRAGVNDFIISNRMISMMFAQISEEPDIQDVYDDLFQEEGSEIYVKPAWLYFHELPITCRFGDLMALVQKRDHEVCIGYKIKAHEADADADANFGVELIPPKDTEVTLTAADGLVVVAEDDM